MDAPECNFHVKPSVGTAGTWFRSGRDTGWTWPGVTESCVSWIHEKQETWGQSLALGSSQLWLLLGSVNVFTVAWFQLMGWVTGLFFDKLCSFISQFLLLMVVCVLLSVCVCVCVSLVSCSWSVSDAGNYFFSGGRGSVALGLWVGQVWEEVCVFFFFLYCRPVAN